MSDKEKQRLKILWVDNETHDRVKIAAFLEGVSMQEMTRRIVGKVPVIGKIEDGKIIMRSEG